jgi:hypothetical protein
MERKVGIMSERKPRTHPKTWACIKPDGDGCDGNHEPDPRAAGVKWAIERMTKEDIEQLVLTIRELDDFFNLDAAKVAEWLSMKNPLLGQMIPIDFFPRGRGHKIYSFVKNALAENKE